MVIEPHLIRFILAVHWHSDAKLMHWIEQMIPPTTQTHTHTYSEPGYIKPRKTIPFPCVDLLWISESCKAVNFCTTMHTNMCGMCASASLARDDLSCFYSWKNHMQNILRAAWHFKWDTIKHLFQIWIWKLFTLNESKRQWKLDAHQGAKMDGSQVDSTHTAHSRWTRSERQIDREIRGICDRTHWRVFQWIIENAIHGTCMRAFYAFHFDLSDHKTFSPAKSHSSN